MFWWVFSFTGESKYILWLLEFWPRSDVPITKWHSSFMVRLGWKIKYTFRSFHGKHLSNSWLTLLLQPEVGFCNLCFAVIPPDKWHPVIQLTYWKMFNVSSVDVKPHLVLRQMHGKSVRAIDIFWNYLLIPKLPLFFKICQSSYQDMLKNVMVIWVITLIIKQERTLS